MSSPHDTGILRVHVVHSDVPSGPKVQKIATPGRKATFMTRILGTDTVTGTVTNAARLLPHAETRRNAVVTIIGQTSDVVWLCSSHVDAQHLQGMAVMGGMVVTLTGTDEVHAGCVAGTSVRIGVAAEYETPGV